MARKRKPTEAQQDTAIGLFVFGSIYKELGLIDNIPTDISGHGPAVGQAPSLTMYCSGFASYCSGFASGCRPRAMEPGAS
jgi:hypothetical protein